MLLDCVVVAKEAGLQRMFRGGRDTGEGGHGQHDLSKEESRKATTPVGRSLAHAARQCSAARARACALHTHPIVGYEPPACPPICRANNSLARVSSMEAQTHS